MSAARPGDELLATLTRVNRGEELRVYLRPQGSRQVVEIGIWAGGVLKHSIIVLPWEWRAIADALLDAAGSGR